VALIVAAATLPFALVGIWRHRAMAPPEIVTLPEPALEPVLAPAGDLSKLVAEARREL